MKDAVLAQHPKTMIIGVKNPMIWSPYRLRQLTGEEEYRAGEHLAERGGVRLMEQGADYVRYAVADEIRRDILISTEEPAVCSCETYQEKGACRHVTAAMLTAREAGVLDEMLRRRASSAGPRLMQAMESALPEDGTLRMEITLFVDQLRRRARPRIRLGLRVGEEHFYTSALATARFLSRQAPGCTAYVIGAPGLLNALYDVGITMNDVDPDYVIAGETTGYNYETIVQAVGYVQRGARLIATNSDLTGPSERGIIPACRALVAPIELATGKKAYYVGKPNPLMMRTGLRLLGVHSNEAVMIGDRMDTDIVAGVETGLDTVLVLSGCTTRDEVENYAYRPRHILNGVGEIPPAE